MQNRLPNLIIAGVTKAGTTSLYFYLVQHPDICGSTVKETEYFSPLQYPDGELASLDTYRRYFRRYRNERYLMEATPSYWYGGARLLERIERTLGAPRYLISLRNPVDRFWSDYTYMCSKALLPGDMNVVDYLERCIELRNARRDFDRENRYFRTLSTGLYIDHLPRWFDAVGDRLRIVFFEDLVVQPGAVVQQMWSWLGLDPSLVRELKAEKYNKTISHRSRHLQRAAYAANRKVGWLVHDRPALKSLLVGAYYTINRAGPRREKLPGDVRARLEEFYAPANAALAHELRTRGIGPLPAWLQREE